MALLSKWFALEELLPDGYDTAKLPPSVRSLLAALAQDILDPLREAMDGPVIVTSGYRPPARNAAAGGVKGSDHLTGNAADFYVLAKGGKAWEDRTVAAFEWIIANLDGKYGQIIMEDHRIALRNGGKLWVHVAGRSVKHPGTPADVSRILVSSAPNQYRQWAPDGGDYS